jgi:hypothetical protein
MEKTISEYVFKISGTSSYVYTLQRLLDLIYDIRDEPVIAILVSSLLKKRRN